jgi:dTDP-4-dehydrorhamnose reductase
MKALVTGSHGAVGHALTRQLIAHQYEVVPWSREEAAPDQPEIQENYLASIAPDLVFHLALPSHGTGRPNEGRLVHVEWTRNLARLTAARGLPFIFTSTVMVFTHHANGPYTAESEPDATDGYGGEKREAEMLARQINSLTRVARLGWQIGEADGSNNMVNHLENQMKEHGVIKVSRLWRPACSFLEDTAAGLIRLAALPPDLYQFDSNRHWTFYEIVEALNHQRGDHWNVQATDDFIYDQRMLDPRPGLPSLSAHLPGLIHT